MSDALSSEEVSANSDAADPAATLPQAPRWRRVTARTIDLTVVLIAFSLFLTPVIATHVTPASSLLRASAWVYVAVFVGLAVSFAAKKRHPPQHYVTVGMSIMDLRSVRVGKSHRLVRGRDLPELEGEKRGRAAAAVVLPLIALGIVLFVFELLAYT